MIEMVILCFVFYIIIKVFVVRGNKKINNNFLKILRIKLNKK